MSIYEWMEKAKEEIIHKKPEGPCLKNGEMCNRWIRCASTQSECYEYRQWREAKTPQALADKATSEAVEKVLSANGLEECVCDHEVKCLYCELKKTILPIVQASNEAYHAAKMQEVVGKVEKLKVKRLPVDGDRSQYEPVINEIAVLRILIKEAQ